MIQILGRKLNSLGVIDNTAPESVATSHDKLNTSLLNGSSTFELDVLQDNPDYEHVDVGNYLLFNDDRGKTRLMQIMTSLSIGGVMEVTAESFGFKLLRKTTSRYESNQPQTIAYYLERELAGTGIVIGINEVIDYKRSLSFDDVGETALARIMYIAQAFGVEIDFSVDFINGNVTGMYLDIMFHRGSPTVKKILEIGKDVEIISMGKDISNLITAVKPVGTNGVTIANIIYNDPENKGIISEEGSEFILNQKANNEWSWFSVPGQDSFGYSEEEISVDSDNPSEVFSQGLKYLESASEIIFKAEIKILQDDLEVEIGDRVMFVDDSKEKTEYLEARVMEMVESDTDPEEVNWICGNYLLHENRLDQSLINKQNALMGNEGLRLELRPKNMVVSPTSKPQLLTANVFKGSRDITSTLLPTEFKWLKTFSDGSSDTAWEQANKNAGNKVMVDVDNLIQLQDKSATISCMIKKLNTTLITKVFFADEYRSIANKILTYSEPDDIKVVFLTDSHQTTDAVNDTSVKVKSVEHIKNAVELANTIDADFCHLNGDLVDGNTGQKTTHIADIKSVTNVLKQFKGAIGVAVGNHDLNSWGDSSLALGNGAQRLTKKERYDLLTQPLKKADIITNKNEEDSSYFYYDIVAKKTRIFVLDTSDLPFDIVNGKPKYDFLENFGFRKPQIDWLVQSLDSVPVDYQVMIFSHYSLYNTYNNGSAVINNHIVNAILKAFIKGTNVTMSNNQTDFAVSVNHTFTKKGTIILTANGHFHRDKVTFTDDYKAPNFGVGCSLARGDDRILDTANEDLFSVFVIRKSNRTIKSFRFGAGEDYTMTY